MDTEKRTDTTLTPQTKAEARAEEKRRDIAVKADEKLVEAELRMETAPSQVGNIILSIVMAALGLVFIWLCDRYVVGSTVLLVGGLAFIIPGAALLLSLLVRRKNKSRGSVMTFMTAVCGLAAVVLGIVILVAPESFRHLLVYLFGGLLIVSAAWQFDVMMRKNRGILYPAWLTIAPVLIVALGVVMCTMEVFKGETNEKWMMLATGCGFALFGIIGLFISYYAIKTNHAARKLAKAAAKTAAAIAATPVTPQSTSTTSTASTTSLAGEMEKDADNPTGTTSGQED